MDIQRLLQTKAAQAGGLRALSRQTKIDVGYLSRVISGEQEPGDQILYTFGLERVVTYRKKNSNGNR